MKIRFTHYSSCCTSEGMAYTDDVYDLPDEEAKMWIERLMAIPYFDEPAQSELEIEKDEDEE